MLANIVVRSWYGRCIFLVKLRVYKEVVIMLTVARPAPSVSSAFLSVTIYVCHYVCQHYMLAS